MRGALSIVLLAGCERTAAPVFVGLPALPDKSHSVLISVVGSGEVHARSARSDAALELPLGSGFGRAVIDATAFEESLGELGLSEGPVSSATEPSAELLPPSNANFELTVEAGRAPAAWISPPARSTLFDAFRVVRPSRCAQFRPRLLALPSRADGSFLLAVSSSVALFGTPIDPPSLYDQQQKTIGTVSAPAGLPRQAAFREPDSGELWFAGGGEIWRGSFDPLATAIVAAPYATLSSSAATTALVVRREGTDQPMIYTVGATGLIERSTAGQTTVLHTFVPSAKNGAIAAVVALAPDGQILFASAVQPNAYRIGAHGDGAVETIPSDGDIGALGFVPGPGFIAGSGRGELWSDGGSGSWSRIDAAPTRTGVFIIAPYESGYVVSAAFGNFTQYIDASFCPVIIPFGFDAHYQVTLGSDLVFFGKNPATTATPIAVLERIVI